ncbi:MAG: hypothetical protein ACXWJ4_07155, partial [Methyloceanibacter sp.]
KAKATPDIGHGIRWQDTPWHRFEIQHYRFRMYMRRLIKKFGAAADVPRQARSMQIDEAKTSDARLKLAS